MTYKLAIVVSHPIQHFVPFYRALAAQEEIDLVVLFASRIGVKPYFDKAMNTTIAWKMDLLSGYEHVFLPEADRITSTGTMKVNNPSVSVELTRQNPDVVLIYGYNFLTSLRALSWCRRRRVPAMMIADSELKTLRSAGTKLIKRMLLPALLKQFTAFLTVGDCNEEYYEHYGVEHERMFRSPFTIDESTYLSARQDKQRLRAEVRSRLSIPEEEVLALTVGKLSVRKRPADVIDAARRLKSMALPVPVSFLLAGDGEEMERLKAVVRAEGLPVRMAGFINVDELPGFYSAADIIVHPSEQDPHPLVMSEAACIGLPLVISDRVGAAGKSDIARLGENAVVFPCGDAQALADNVASLVSDAEVRARMEKCSQYIYDELNMRRSVEGALLGVRYSVQ